MNGRLDLALFQPIDLLINLQQAIGVGGPKIFAASLLGNLLHGRFIDLVVAVELTPDAGGAKPVAHGADGINLDLEIGARSAASSGAMASRVLRAPLLSKMMTFCCVGSCRRRSVAQTRASPMLVPTGSERAIWSTACTTASWSRVAGQMTSGSRANVMTPIRSLGRPVSPWSPPLMKSRIASFTASRREID